MAGTTVVNAVQLGNSATATQNFVAQTNQDGSGKLSRGNVGATTQDIVTWDSSGNVNIPTGALTVGGVNTGRLTLSTAQNTTSGTSIDFTGIPSWVKRITVMFSGVSTNGTSPIQVQLGSGSVDATSNYAGGRSYLANSGTVLATASSASAGAVLEVANANLVAGTTRHGSAVIANITGNTWIISHNAADSSGNNTMQSSWSKTLSGTLDRIRLTTVNGTDTFDAGSVNILYEG